MKKIKRLHPVRDAELIADIRTRSAKGQTNRQIADKTGLALDQVYRVTSYKICNSAPMRDAYGTRHELGPAINSDAQAEAEKRRSVVRKREIAFGIAA